MRMQSMASRLRGTTSVLALSAVAVVGASALQPAAAANSFSTFIYGGGSTLASLSMRQIFDCYMGAAITNTTAPYTADGYSFSTTFNANTTNPGQLPSACQGLATAVEGFYAGVGSGSGIRAFVADDAQLLLQSGNLLPVAQPSFADGDDMPSYPYPHVDFGASDAPLGNGTVTSVTGLTTVSFTYATTSNWTTFAATQAITTTGSTVVTYQPTAYGAPIQVPAFEVPVAIAINLANGTNGATWNVQSTITTTPTYSTEGTAIQLSTAQLCAIFSGLVTDWSDTGTQIPYLDSNGVQHTEPFYFGNTDVGLTPVAYVSGGSLPITVVYRSDGSGTSFITTNYLHTVCPLIDPNDNFGYVSIFKKSNLPSTTFANLIKNIQAFRGSSAVTNWLGASGSGGVATTISDSVSNPAGGGYIGYLSNDFTAPWTTSVTGVPNGGSGTVTVDAPVSASVQNERLRVNGVYHPGDSGAYGSPTGFVAPNGYNADTAWQALNTAANTWTWADWNVYNQVYPTGTTEGGVTLDGLSQLGITNVDGAYPLVGTTFLELYSCYSDPAGTRVPMLQKFLAWYLGGSDGNLPPYSPSTISASHPEYDADVSNVIRNNGFHELRVDYAQMLLTEFVKPKTSTGLSSSIAAYSSSGTQVNGCIGVTSGAAF